MSDKQQEKIEKLEWALDVKQKYIEKIEKENNALKSTITLLEYQLKVQDRIIEEYEGG